MSKDSVMANLIKDERGNLKVKEKYKP